MNTYNTYLENVIKLSKDHFTDINFVKNDILLVIDMQLDFVPNSHEIGISPFAVKEGDLIIQPIGVLCHKFLSKDNGYVVASRDYHPENHKSFKANNKKGIYPTHCIQGTPGAEIVKRIAKTLLKKDGTGIHNRAHIVFKGIDPNVDSYSASKYIKKNRGVCIGGACLMKSGAFKLKCSGHSLINQNPIFPGLGNVNGTGNINSPPDITLDKLDFDKMRMENLSFFNKAKHIFVVGLALDFCVVDSAINLSKNNNVYIIMDLCRPVFIGDNYITSPEDFVKMIKKSNVKLITSNNIKKLPKENKSFYSFYGKH